MSDKLDYNKEIDPAVRNIFIAVVVESQSKDKAWIYNTGPDDSAARYAALDQVWDLAYKILTTVKTYAELKTAMRVEMDAGYAAGGTPGALLYSYKEVALLEVSKTLRQAMFDY